MQFYIYILLCTLFLSCKNTHPTFELCPGGLYPYYFVDLKYKGDFYAIKEQFNNHYKPFTGANHTGIVKIKFHINCKGESGNFDLETYNLNYKDTIIHSDITNQLLHITKSLNGWGPPKDDEGIGVNSHKFLAFRIINGKLIHILPK